MFPNLVSSKFINDLKKNDKLIGLDTQTNNDIIEPFFDNDFFYTLIVILLLSFFLAFIFYTKYTTRKSFNKKKNMKFFNNIRNYCDYVKKTEYLKNLNNY